LLGVGFNAAYGEEGEVAMVKYSKIGVLPIVVLLLVGTAFAGENADVVLSVDVSATGVRADTPTEVTLTVSVQGALNVSGLGVKVAYDTAAVSLVSGAAGAFMPVPPAVNPGLDVATPGVVGAGAAILGADADAAPDGDGVLATFTFSVTLAEDQETALTVSEVQLLGVPASSKDVFADVAIETITGRAVVVGSLSISPSSRGRTSVAVGGTQVFTASAKDTDGNAMDVSDMIVWTADEALGTLEAAGSEATLTAATTAATDLSLTASVGDVSAEVLVTLSPGPLASLSITMTKPAFVKVFQGRKVLRAGQDVEFVVAGQDEYGNAVSVSSTMWSLDGDIGTISMLSGKMKAATTVLSTGNPGAVKAAKSGVEASMTVRVMPATAKRIEVTPAEVTVEVGGSVDFSATIYDEFGNTVDTGRLWGVVGDIGRISAISGTFFADKAGSGIIVAFASPAAFGGTVAGVTAASKVTVVADVPQDFELQGNYPNPFNPETTIRYALPTDGTVSIVIYDAMGQEVARLLDGVNQEAGYHSIQWNGRDAAGQEVASGVYLYTMHAGTFHVSKKMTLLR